MDLATGLTIFVVGANILGPSDTPMIASERPAGCIEQIGNSNAYAKTGFALANLEYCGFAPIDFTAPDETHVVELPDH